MDRLAVIIGACRAGSTTLFRTLASHPEVCPASQKEPMFFSNPEQYQKGYEWYEEQWSEHDLEGKIALEASTQYTNLPESLDAAELLARYREARGVDVRLIYSVRDPVDRIKSHMKITRSNNWPAPADPQEFLARFIFRSMYATQLEEYTEHFDRDEILLLKFEDWIDTLEETTECLGEFLGLDDPTDFEAPGGALNRSEEQWRANGLARLLGRLRLLPAAANLVESEWLKEFSKGLLGDYPGRTELDLGQDLERYLERILEPEVRRLRGELGFKKASWPRFHEAIAKATGNP